MNKTIKLELNDEQWQVFRECMNIACLEYITRSVDIDMLTSERQMYSEKYDIANSVRNQVYGYFLEESVK